MSRFLHRPMFRRGGSTGEGITSGLVPRQRYENAGDVQPNFEQQALQSIINTPIELPKSTAGADFWLNFGSNILAQPGGRPILQTLGTAGKEPLARFQQQRAAEGKLKYQHQVGSRAFMLEAWKALNEDERLELQKKAKIAFENGDFDSYEEALSEFIKASLYTKSGHYRPEVQKRLEEEYERDKLEADIGKTQSGISKETAYVSPNQAEIINKFYDQAHAQDPVWEYESDIPYIDKQAIKNEWIELKKTEDQWISKEGNIAISPNEQATYEEGYYYVDRFNGDVYKVGPGSTELIKIDLDEIKIN